MNVKKYYGAFILLACLTFAVCVEELLFLTESSPILKNLPYEDFDAYVLTIQWRSKTSFFNFRFFM